MKLAMRPEANEIWNELGVTPGPVVRVFGMRRAGNHAIINWLLRNAPSEGTVFLNNCVAGRHPFRGFKTLEVNGQRCTQKGERKALADFAVDAGEGATLLVSYEDVMPNRVPSGQAISGNFDESLFGQEVLVYRSFLNWAASLVKKIANNPTYKQAHRTIILLRALEQYSASLEMVMHQQALNMVAICYDDWLQSADYRADILGRMGFAQRDDSLGKVQSYGGGSSFQPEEGEADKLSTDRRWQQMAADPLFQIVLWLFAQDAEFLDRLDAIFPDDADRLRRFAGQDPFSTGPETGGLQ